MVFDYQRLPGIRGPPGRLIIWCHWKLKVLKIFRALCSCFQIAVNFRSKYFCLCQTELSSTIFPLIPVRYLCLIYICWPNGQLPGWPALERPYLLHVYSTCLYVCMYYVCMYVCMHVCTYVCMYVCIFLIKLYWQHAPLRSNITHSITQ